MLCHLRIPLLTSFILSFSSFTINGISKQQAVLDYLAGYGSQDDICKKYGIRSKAKLQIWIKKYNGHEELKSSGTGGKSRSKR